MPGPQIAGLVREPKNWGFIADRSKASLFACAGEQVTAQPAATRKRTGRALKILCVDSSQFYETCDRCKRQRLPFDLYFDGDKFLCRDCRK
jgi:hypothetical protein